MSDKSDEQEVLTLDYHKAHRIYNPPPLLTRMAIEYIGTFFLVFTISVNQGGGPGREGEGTGDNQAAAIGAVLMVVCYMGGHLSGAHYNPAVSTAVLLRNMLSVNDYIAYVSVQLAAGLLAGVCGYAITDYTPAPKVGAGYNEGEAWAVECLYTFLLASVVLNCTCAGSQNQNSFFGMAIGFTVFVGIVTCEDISGGVFNPAVATGLNLVDGFNGNTVGSMLWISWTANMVGGVIAAAVFRITNAREF